MRSLVVDDSSVARRILKKHLEEAGAVVVGEANGSDQALSMLRAGMEIDAVFVDKYMPDGDGISLAKAIRLLPAYGDVYIVMVSSDGSAAEVSAALDSGIDDYLTKPFDHLALTTKLSAAGVAVTYRL